MTNGKILPVLSETGLEAVEKLEEMGILIKDDGLDEDVRKVDLDELFKVSAGGIQGGFEVAMISLLHNYVKEKSLLLDPYVTIDAAGEREREVAFEGASTVHRKKDVIVESCPKCEDGGDMHHVVEHVWVRKGLYRYETGRTISCCHKCWWSNRREIENEEQARIDSGDMTDWGARI